MLPQGGLDSSSNTSSCNSSTPSSPALVSHTPAPIVTKQQQFHFPDVVTLQTHPLDRSQVSGIREELIVQLYLIWLFKHVLVKFNLKCTVLLLYHQMSTVFTVWGRHLVPLYGYFFIISIRKRTDNIYIYISQVTFWSNIFSFTSQFNSRLVNEDKDKLQCQVMAR